MTRLGTETGRKEDKKEARAWPVYSIKVNKTEKGQKGGQKGAHK
jgi:hypothetical protein